MGNSRNVVVRFSVHEGEDPIVALAMPVELKCGEMWTATTDAEGLYWRSSAHTSFEAILKLLEHRLCIAREA